MSKFEKYRIHFDMKNKHGKLSAHSDLISPDQVEEYCKAFGCGYGHIYAGGKENGNMYWHADHAGEDKNSWRLLKEWLASKMPKIFPHKAARLRDMLNESD